MDFVSPLPKGLDTTCSVCFESLHVDPYQNIDCGHHLCGKCVPNFKKPYNNSCPECRAPLKVIADKSLQRVLKSLRVYCRYKKDGCTWQGDLGSLNYHEENLCLHTLSSCPFLGCEFKAKQGELMNEHKINCSFKPATCQFCDYKFPYTDQYLTDNHYQMCLLYPVTCSCQETLPRKDLDDHKKVKCPDTEVACKFSEYGCKWIGMRKDEHNHIMSESVDHLNFSLKVTEKLTAKVMNLENTLKHLEEHYEDDGESFGDPDDFDIFDSDRSDIEYDGYDYFDDYDIDSDGYSFEASYAEEPYNIDSDNYDDYY
jgi:hypothetical protein